MKKLWFITNPNSGTATPAKCEALEAAFVDRGLILAGRTDFPAQDIPTGESLDANGADTVVLYAGDGTINAALTSLSEWKGDFLILPGGTMNLLAKGLHDAMDSERIIQAAHDSKRRVPVPYVEAGQHRAYVGMILGPAATWARAREAARKGRFSRMFGAIRSAWRRTFSGGIRVAGARGLKDHYQAVFIFPKADHLDVTGIDARDWSTIALLGWDWVTGAWVESKGAVNTHAQKLEIVGDKPVMALFDGEPVNLHASSTITCGMTRENFIATRQEAAG